MQKYDSSVSVDMLLQIFSTRKKQYTVDQMHDVFKGKYSRYRIKTVAAQCSPKYLNHVGRNTYVINKEGLARKRDFIPYEKLMECLKICFNMSTFTAKEAKEALKGVGQDIELNRLSHALRFLVKEGAIIGLPREPNKDRVYYLYRENNHFSEEHDTEKKANDCINKMLYGK